MEPRYAFICSKFSEINFYFIAMDETGAGGFLNNSISTDSPAEKQKGVGKSYILNITNLICVFLGKKNSECSTSSDSTNPR